jgi:hypothetical protein
MPRRSKNLNSSLFEFRSTENKNIFVGALPQFIRANKYIGRYLIKIYNNEVQDGCPVVIKAYSEKTREGELKNNVSIVQNGIACFEDFRFIGKSGRGKAT